MPYTSQYPPLYVTADMVVLSRRPTQSVLLVRRASPPYEGRLALPGGFVEPDESLDDAARRELREETGVDAGDADELRQLGAYGAPDRDPRGRIVSVAYLTVVDDVPETTAGDDAAETHWQPVDELRAGDLAFDHAEILEAALAVVRDG